MKKDYQYLVKWNWTDHNGFNREPIYYNWFEALEEANEYIAKMIKGNGFYFNLIAMKQADYQEYVKMLKLEKELAKLKAKF